MTSSQNKSKKASVMPRAEQLEAELAEVREDNTKLHKLMWQVQEQVAEVPNLKTGLNSAREEIALLKKQIKNSDFANLKESLRRARDDIVDLKALVKRYAPNGYSRNGGNTRGNGYQYAAEEQLFANNAYEKHLPTKASYEPPTQELKETAELPEVMDETSSVSSHASSMAKPAPSEPQPVPLSAVPAPILQTEVPTSVPQVPTSQVPAPRAPAPRASAPRFVVRPSTPRSSPPPSAAPQGQRGQARKEGGGRRAWVSVLVSRVRLGFSELDMKRIVQREFCRDVTVERMDTQSKDSLAFKVTIVFQGVSRTVAVAQALDLKKWPKGLTVKQFHE